MPPCHAEYICLNKSIRLGSQSIMPSVFFMLMCTPLFEAALSGVADPPCLQGRQPGWLFDDADAAEAAANFFNQPDDLYNSNAAPLSRPSSRPARHNLSTPPTSRTAAFANAAGHGCPQAGPWDALRITQKLLKCIGPELSSCKCEQSSRVAVLGTTCAGHTTAACGSYLVQKPRSA